MNTRIYHGDISTEDFAVDLEAYYANSSYEVKRYGNQENMAIQIATREYREAGGETALTVNLLKIEDGVSVQVNEQRLLGVAASFGRTALEALRNPLSVLNNLDDIAQDYESTQLEERVWAIIDNTARQHYAGEGLSKELQTVVCPYCTTANKLNEAACIACGAPLGNAQPRTCQYCGYLLRDHDRSCPNCGKPVQ